MNESKEEVTPGFIKAAGQYLTGFLNVKGLKIGSISLALTYCVYRLYQIVWLRDLCKTVVNGCINFLWYTSSGIYNTASYMKYATIKSINATTGYFSIQSRKDRTERDEIRRYVTDIMQHFQNMALDFNEECDILLKNLDQTLYQVNYDKVHDICYQQYGNSGPEFKKCVANVQLYTLQVRKFVQDNNLRHILVNPKAFSIITEGKININSFNATYGTTLENLLLEPPDPDKFYRLTGKKLPDLWDTRFINKPGFEPYFGLMSPDAAKKIISEEEYNKNKLKYEQDTEAVNDPVGTARKLRNEIDELREEVAKLQNMKSSNDKQKQIEQKQKQKASDYLDKHETDIPVKEVIEDLENSTNNLYNKHIGNNSTNHWMNTANNYNATHHLRGPENPLLDTTQQDTTVGDIGATVALTTMAYGLYRYVRNLFNRQPEPPTPQVKQPVVKQTTEPPAIPIDTPPGDDSMLRPRYRRKQEEDDDEQEDEQQQDEQSEINRDKEKTD